MFSSYAAAQTDLQSIDHNIKIQKCVIREPIKPKDNDDSKINQDRGAYRIVREIAIDSIQIAVELAEDIKWRKYERNYPIVYHLLRSNLHADSGQRSSALHHLQIAQARYHLKDPYNRKFKDKELELIRKCRGCLEDGFQNTSNFINRHTGPPLIDTVKVVQKDTVLKYFIPERKRVHTVDTIYYRPDHFKAKYLDSLNLAKLKEVAERLRPCQDCKVVIMGFADDTGNEKYNEELSKNRAEEVQMFFKRSKLDVADYQTKSFGERGSWGDNKRKVEIHVYDWALPIKP